MLAPRMEASTDITAQRAAELLAQGVTLVDVREDYERDAGHIAGTRHIGLAALTAAAAAGEIDAAAPVVFYCRVGGRSKMATDAFRASGYEAYNLAGGLLAWVDAGLPLVPQDGHVADH